MGGATGAACDASHAGDARRCVTVRARNPRDPELGPKRTACGGQASARCPDPVARNQRARVGSAAGCDSPRHRESDARFEQPVRRSGSCISACARPFASPRAAGGSPGTGSGTHSPRDSRHSHNGNAKDLVVGGGGAEARGRADAPGSDPRGQVVRGMVCLGEEVRRPGRRMPRRGSRSLQSAGGRA